MIRPQSRRKPFFATSCAGLLLLVCGAALCFSSGTADASILYRETYKSAEGESKANALAAGWMTERKGAAVNEGQIFTNTGGSTELPAVNSNSGPAPTAFLFWSPKTHDILLYTNEYPFQMLGRFTLTLLWDSKNSFDYGDVGGPPTEPDTADRQRNKMRAALQIGGKWYVSDDFYYTAGPVAPNPNSSRWDAQDWETHKHVVEGSETYSEYDITIGSAGRLKDPGQSLPLGPVTAFGIFLDGNTVGNIRIDNFTIEQNLILEDVPVPALSWYGLIFLGFGLALAGAFAVRMRKAKA